MTLKYGTTKCPCHNQPLWFEQFAGMRIVRDKMLHAICGITRENFAIDAKRKNLK